MPPSMLSSEALVIWMLRIAMNAPIMAARMGTQTVAEARSVWAGSASGALLVARCTGAGLLSARSDMASPLQCKLRQTGFGSRTARRGPGHGFRGRSFGLNARDDRHTRPQLDAGFFQRDLHGDA